MRLEPVYLLGPDPNERHRGGDAKGKGTSRRRMFAALGMALSAGFAGGVFLGRSWSPSRRSRPADSLLDWALTIQDAPAAELLHHADAYLLATDTLRDERLIAGLQRLATILRTDTALTANEGSILAAQLADLIESWSEARASVDTTVLRRMR